VLTEDVKKWEQAADNLDRLMPHIPLPDREAEKQTAAEYRDRAAHYNALIEQVKNDHGA
jgi:hypothetical protein